MKPFPRVLIITAAAMLSAGLLLLIKPVFGQSPDGAIEATIEESDRITGNNARHQTNWKCHNPPNNNCNKGPGKGTLEHGKIWPRACPDENDCGHTAPNTTWQYQNHQDYFNVTWKCDREDYIPKPATSQAWGKTYTGSRAGKQLQPEIKDIPQADRSRCLPRPKLTVDNASALEGGTLRFNIKLEHISREVQLGYAVRLGSRRKHPSVFQLRR